MVGAAPPSRGARGHLCPACERPRLPARQWVPNTGRTRRTPRSSVSRLFKIIEDLVLWENTTNEVVLEAARAEIRRSWQEVCALNKDHPQAVELFNPEKLPALHDPFAGGGAIPLEAQRLGLEACASDLNPVAVLINKAMIEIPPKFAGHAPMGPLPADEDGAALDLPRLWSGVSGLAEDVRRYGAWMRAEAQKRIGHLYPLVEVTPEMARDRPDLTPLVGQKLTVIAWLWARTVKSPNPAFSHVDVPLASTFILASKEGKDAYVQPVVSGDRYRFTVAMGAPPPGAEHGTKPNGRGANFSCIVSNAPISGDPHQSPRRSPEEWGRSSWLSLPKGPGAAFTCPQRPKSKTSPDKPHPHGSLMWNSANKRLASASAIMG